jgi:hypothetical protein
VIGKPNLPPEADEGSEVKGAARPTPGLNRIDQEREASMADEGGAAGAAAEAEDAEEPEKQ